MTTTSHGDLREHNVDASSRDVAVAAGRDIGDDSPSDIESDDASNG